MAKKKKAKKKALKTGSEKKPAKEQRAAKSGAVLPQVDRSFPVVGMGASAGGLEAFEAFFKKMPADSGMAFVLVAHLDPTHVSILPEILQKQTTMKVTQVKDGMKVHANCVYVIPPNKDLGILNGVLQLMDFSLPRGSNLPIDFFFRSLAQDQGANAICVILSGTGSDGTLGLKAIKGALGMVMVQDEESAKYDGMPSSAIATQLADYVLPPEKMPEQLIKYTKHAFLKAAPQIVPVGGMIPNALQKIFVILRDRTGHDFSLYKENTLCRRIERRMNVHQIDDISDYVLYLQESHQEANILFKELLIGVTNFFRDPQAFDSLTKKVLPKLLKGIPNDYNLRVWVPGCSSGEEAYSIAMILHEYMEEHKCHFNVQIFSTDIDSDAIDIARGGLYPASILTDVGAERLKRYFIKEDDGQYRIKKNIREMLVFASQNIIKDPPFTKLDLLCCRNLLIYLDVKLQKKLLSIFHYSLKPGGILFLGSSETIGQATDLFTLVDNKWKIFRSKPSASTTHAVLDFPTALIPHERTELEIPESIKKIEEISAFQLVETILQQSNAPPCAIINSACDVLYIHGRTGRFLEPAEGKISVNILEMARLGLRSELAAAIHKVSTYKQEVIYRNLRVEYNGSYLYLDLIVRSILERGIIHGLMMVVFQEVPSPEKPAKGKPKRIALKKASKTAAELELELQHTKENLQTNIEELETSNEELKSTNEELQSTNEELQSTNEELETSKEELQSLNEELQSSIHELAALNNDMKNLFDSTEIAIVFLDANLGIRRFTPKAIEIIPLAGTDTGRPIKHFASNLIEVDLSRLAEEVLTDLSVKEVEVKDNKGQYYIMRARPYSTVSNVIDGVVITFEDITELKRVEIAALEEKAYAESIVDTVRESLLVLDADLRIVSASRSFYQTFQVTPQETEGQLLWDLGDRQWDILALRKLLEENLPQNATMVDFEVEHEFLKIGQRVMFLNARQIYWEANQTKMILLAIEDVTKRRRAERELKKRNIELERSNKELDDFTHIVSHDLKESLRGIRTYSNMLIDHYDAELNATGHAHLRTLVEQTNRLDKFINSLLQYSQIRMTEPAIKKTNIHIVLTEIVDSLQADLEPLGVEIRIPKHLPTIMCDRVHIEEVFKNLVSNAIKFNDKSQKWVEVSYLDDLDSAPGKPILEGTEVKVYPYIFYVRDNGIGIRPRHLESIFAIFKRLHGREEFGGGTGAGLTIVKKIIERHGGQIWIESTYGEGTTFYFTWQGD